MANFYVKNANHGFDLISISYNAQSFLIRSFKSTDSIEGLTQIPLDGLTHNMNQYGDGHYLQYNGSNYRLCSSLSLTKDYGEVQVGGVYIVYMINELELGCLRLDSAKFPDLEIYDWRYLIKQGYKPILKFCLSNDNQAFTSIPKVYYLNATSKDSPVYITDDDLENVGVYTDGQTNVLPPFSYTVQDETITITSDADVSGKLRIINNTNIVTDSTYTLNAGSVVIANASKRNAMQDGTFDVLYGFSKVLTVTL